MIGTEIVVNALPDGYTVLLSASQEIVINPNLYKKLRYDPAKDLMPVTLVARAPNVFVTHPSLPAASLKDFIELATRQPGKLTYASFGAGSSQHIAGEVFEALAKISLVHVPYQGAVRKSRRCSAERRRLLSLHCRLQWARYGKAG